MKHTLILDASRILCDSMCSRKKRMITLGNPYNIGGFLEFLSILRDCCLKFSDISDLIIAWDGGINPKRKALIPEYKDYNEYFIESQFLSKESEDNEDYLRQKALIIKHTPFLRHIEVPGLEREDLISVLISSNDPSELYTIVNDDDESYVFLKENVQLYRPFENTLVYLNSFLLNNNLTDINSAIKEFCLCGHSFDKTSGCCPGVAETFIKDLLHLYDKLGTSFLTLSENALRDFCTQEKISYRKAFYNFDQNKYYNLLKVYNYPALELVDEEQIQLIKGKQALAKRPDDYYEQIKSSLQQNKVLSVQDWEQYKISYRYGN